MMKYISAHNLLLLAGLSGNFVIGDVDPTSTSSIAGCTFCPKKSNCVAAIPNTPDSFNTDFGWVACLCKQGYTGDGWRCSEVNECIVGSPCPSNAFCVDTAPDATDFPGYKCGCSDGFETLTVDEHDAARCGLPGDTIEPSVSPTVLAISATVVATLSSSQNPTFSAGNETDLPVIIVGPTAAPTIAGCTFCPKTSKCVAAIPNTPDAFETPLHGWVECLCDEGYVGDGWRCEKMNECILSDPCPSNNGFCVDTDPDDAEFPDYKCGCSDGYEIATSNEHGATSCRVITQEPSMSPAPTVTVKPTATTKPTISPLPTLSKAPILLTSSPISILPSVGPSESPEPTPSPSMLPSSSSRPSGPTEERDLTPTISNSPSASDSPSVTSFPSLTPSVSQQPSETIFPSATPSVSQEPSITVLPSLTPT